MYEQAGDVSNIVSSMVWGSRWSDPIMWSLPILVRLISAVTIRIATAFHSSDPALCC